MNVMDEVLQQLLPQVKDAAKKLWQCDEKEADLFAAQIENLIKSKDIDRLIGGEEHSTDISQVQNEYLIEIDPHYIGFKSPINMNEFVRKNSTHPIYQIIFEDTAQKLIFEYVGTDYKMLEVELAKLYPNTKIDRTYDDVVVNQAHSDYTVMNNELQCMKNRLKVINPILAKQCIKKELQLVNGTCRKAIKSRLEPRERATAMLSIVVNVIRGDKNILIIGNNNTVQQEKKSREELHKEWIINNPPRMDEPSSKYYNRLKNGVTNPVSVQNHANILRELNYKRIRNEKGSIWVGKS